MDVEDLTDGSAILPGDVVIDSDTHRPMQVTGLEMRRADQIRPVWESNVNRHKYDIEPDASVLELVGLPTGNQYFVPDTVDRYPEVRLDRVLTAPATGERRPQAKVVRSAISHLVNDARYQGHDALADAIIGLCRRNWGREFGDEIEEIAASLGQMEDD